MNKNKFVILGVSILMSFSSIAVYANESNQHVIDNTPEKKTNEAPKVENNPVVPKPLAPEVPEPPVEVEINSGYFFIETLDRDTEDGISGSTFEIHDHSGRMLTFFKDGDVYKYDEKARNGKIEMVGVSTIRIDNMPFSSFKIINTGSPKSYKTAEEQQVSLSKDGEKFVVKFSQDKYDVDFTIKDEDNKGIEKAKYQVLDKDGKKISFKKDGQAYVQSKTGDETVVESDKHGFVRLRGLGSQDIKMELVEIPKGYVMNSSVQEFKLDKGNISREDIVNHKISSTLRALTSDGKGISGVEVDVYKKGTTDLSDTVAKFKTDKEGRADLIELEPGDYFYMVRSVPSPYAVKRTKSPFSIKENREFEDLKSPEIYQTQIRIFTPEDESYIYKLKSHKTKRTVADLVVDGEDAIFNGLDHGEYELYRVKKGENISKQTNYMKIEVNSDSYPKDEGQKFEVIGGFGASLGFKKIAALMLLQIIPISAILYWKSKKVKEKNEKVLYNTSELPVFKHKDSEIDDLYDETAIEGMESILIKNKNKNEISKNDDIDEQKEKE